MAKNRAGARRGQRRRPRWVWAAWGTALVVAVVSVGVAITQGGGSGAGGGDSASGVADFRIVAYQGQDVLGGEEVNFASLVGRGRPVILNFWAGLCPPCRQEMPTFQRVYDEYEGRIVLVGVDVGPFTALGSHDDARDFLREFDIRYPTGYATAESPLRQYAVRSMPTTIFFDGEGNVAGRHLGILTEDQLRDRMRQLLGER